MEENNNKTNTATIWSRLFKFQQTVEPILKSESGYGYKYADLSGIIEKIKPTLKACGLGFSQQINGDDLVTIIFDHSTGENITSTTRLGISDLAYEANTKYSKDSAGNVTKTENFIIRGFEGMNKAQAAGAIITYFRRYALCSILGITADEDTNAHASSATHNHSTNVRR